MLYEVITVHSGLAVKYNNDSRLHYPSVVRWFIFRAWTGCTELRTTISGGTRSERQTKGVKCFEQNIDCGRTDPGRTAHGPEERPESRITSYNVCYTKLLRKAFCEEFVSPRGRLTSDTQTSYIVALYMNLVPEAFRPRLIEALKANLEKNNNYLKTGFVGTPYLCRVLSENGCNDLAYQLLLNEEFPSWLYAVKLGATTIWERWNSP